MKTEKITLNTFPFLKDIKIISRVWKKAEFQKMRKALVQQGFKSEKIEGGYVIHNGKFSLVRAAKGFNGYLVRLPANLFE